MASALGLPTTTPGSPSPTVGSAFGPAGQAGEVGLARNKEKMSPGLERTDGRGALKSEAQGWAGRKPRGHLESATDGTVIL